ncbi:MAG: metallophosphoesterase [Propionibacteriales bacterium]|nr:metallophosphoesterase [Propionibacteriales bacterium]
MAPSLARNVLAPKRRYSARAALPLAVAFAIITATGGATPSSGAKPTRQTPGVTAVRVLESEPRSTRSSAAPAPVRIAAAGDIACESPYTVTRFTCRHGATARLISSRSVDAVLPLGDTQYASGQRTDYESSYAPTWGVFKGRTYPVIGNHEYGDPDARGFLSYFGARVPTRRVWYASNLGAWRVYVLNSNCNQVSCAAQVRWLKKDLVAHPRRCSLAAMHHPRFSSGEHGDSQWAAQFWPALDAHQVDLVLAGHDHDYERFAPRHSSGAIAANGLRSFVVGTGGKSLYSFTTVEAGSRFRYARRAGVLFLSLRHRSYTWRYRTTNGTVLDSGSANCLR